MRQNRFLVAAALTLLMIVGGIFFISKQEKENFSLPTIQEDSSTAFSMFITKPYPLNDGDYVANPGGHFVDLEITTERQTAIYHPKKEAFTVELTVEETIIVDIEEIETEDKDEEAEEEVGTMDTSDESSMEVESSQVAADDASTENATEVEETTEATPLYIVEAQHYAVGAEEIYFTWPIREYTSDQKMLLAQMLYCEAGGKGWDCQVATLSAIINHIEHYGGNFSVLDNGNHFSPASYYRYRTPTSTNWEVLDYVLSGHLIANVKYFQLYNYHSFGTPMFKIGGVYFSK